MDPDGQDKESAIRVFVAFFSLGCTIVSMIYAIGSLGSAAVIDRVATLPYSGIAIFMAAILLGTAASLLLVDLLSRDNPGLTTALLNGGTNLATYWFGTIIYGSISWKGASGVLLISIGTVLTQ